MTPTARTPRTAVAAAFATGFIAGTMLLGTAASASAEPAPPPPNCTAADLAGIMSGVMASTSSYLFTHPDVNTFFTGLKGQPRDQIREQVQSYLDANPQIRADIQGIRQPSVDFRNRCGLEAP